MDRNLQLFSKIARRFVNQKSIALSSTVSIYSISLGQFPFAIDLASRLSDRSDLFNTTPVLNFRIAWIPIVPIKNSKRIEFHEVGSFEWRFGRCSVWCSASFLFSFHLQASRFDLRMPRDERRKRRRRRRGGWPTSYRRS